MRRSVHLSAPVSLAFAALIAGCVAGDARESSSTDEGAFTSPIATLLDFDFDGELVSSSAANLNGQIRAQLLYTVGHVNGELGVSRLAKLALTNVTSAAAGGGLYRIRYHAKLPVAWGRKSGLPTSYAFTLPQRVDAAGTSAFTQKYSASCNDDEGAQITTSNFWYHYRPHAFSCSLAAADVVTARAAVTVSATNVSSPKYPEYRKIWEDGALNVVAVFGKYEAGATSASDAGIAAYNAFLSAARLELGSEVTTTPAALAENPGTSAPDVTLEAPLSNGRTVTVSALLVDDVGTAPSSFDKRYGELVTGADFIVYDGHAGLGANIRALSQKGKFFPGKYQLFFMNGCDTFAYADDALATTRAVLNPDDRSGTRYMDVVTNAMPAFFNAMPGASMAILRALLVEGAPQSYSQILDDVDPSQIVVVTGEEDNAFSPSMGNAQPPIFATAGQLGKSESVAYTTSELAAGTYIFAMTPEPGFPGGDADLYLRAGSAPTATPGSKCPSYLYNSNERCALTLAAPAKVFMIAKGDSIAEAHWVLRAWRL